MKSYTWILPLVTVTSLAALSLQTNQARGFSLLGGELGFDQRDFRIWNNFTDPDANNNQTPDANFPSASGAEIAIWKGVVEWQSTAHGSGNGDPHQPGGLGSGLSNYDPTYQGLTDSSGTTNDNVHSQISGCNGGVLAFTEIPISNGWRIRYYECWNWQDGPGTSISGWDLQSIACHEQGHAVGLGHSNVGGATMWPSVGSGQIGNRSIHSDDSAGVQAVYGSAPGNKPRIDSVVVVGDTITINGSNLPISNGQVWYTRAVPGDGTVLKYPSPPGNGSTLVINPIPNNVGPGDVLVLRPGGGFDDLSNAAPIDATGPLCGPPENYCTAAPNSAGSGMTISSIGSPEVSDQFLTLFGSGGPPGMPGIFYYGPDQTQVPFGDGFRCVGSGGAGTFRLPVIQIDGFGDVTYEVDWNSAPIDAGPGAIVGGSTWNFQFWYRDPLGGPAGFNLSDALTMQFCD